jgi:hypothetical protein
VRLSLCEGTSWIYNCSPTHETADTCYITSASATSLERTRQIHVGGNRQPSSRKRAVKTNFLSSVKHQASTPHRMSLNAHLLKHTYSWDLVLVRNHVKLYCPAVATPHCRSPLGDSFNGVAASLLCTCSKPSAAHGIASDNKAIACKILGNLGHIPRMANGGPDFLAQDIHGANFLVHWTSLTDVHF